MQEQLLNHVRHNNLFQSHDRIVVAVSGGIDSMVLLHLLHTAGCAISVAHCNFQLRGEESDGDEALVRKACETYAIPCHVRRFHTRQYAETHRLSIQMAARELRYTFFETLRHEQGYACIATAHHANDNLETVLLNLVRGTGIDGVTGIPLRNGYIVRPLLFATRAAIEAYARQHNLAWREDSSNASDHYHRNLIRNQVMPLLRTINPALDEGFADTAARLAGARALATEALATRRTQIITEQGGRMHIDSAALAQQTWPDVTLWELIKSYGFTYPQSQAIVRHHQPGAQFTTASHSLFVDRNQYIIQPHEHHDQTTTVNIAAGQAQASMLPVSLTLQTLPKAAFTLQRDPALAQLDRSKLQFPLTWRYWQPGDSFVPLGMKHPKKISDFLVDLRMPLPDKRHVTVLTSGGHIVWVTGLRVSDTFKVTDNTQEVLIVKATSA